MIVPILRPLLVKRMAQPTAKVGNWWTGQDLHLRSRKAARLQRAGLAASTTDPLNGGGIGNRTRICCVRGNRSTIVTIPPWHARSVSRRDPRFWRPLCKSINTSGVSKVERQTGAAPAAFALATRHSAVELLALRKMWGPITRPGPATKNKHLRMPVGSRPLGFTVVVSVFRAHLQALRLHFSPDFTPDPERQLSGPLFRYCQNV